MTAPLTPADCDLTDFAFMPLDVARLFGSSFHARATDGEWRAGVTLWAKSWHQVPAASLPDDDVELARLAEFGRDVRSWRKVRDGALRGWAKADDGLLYHPVVAEKALEAWLEKLAQRLSSGAGNAKRYGNVFDPGIIEAAVSRALEGLESLNPNSKALRRRASRMAAAKKQGTHTIGEWQRLLALCGPKCLKCGAQGPLDKDHIKPISAGGSDAIDNLQPLCPRCNSGKGLDETDFRPSGWREVIGSPPASRPPPDGSATGSQETGTGTGTGIYSEPKGSGASLPLDLDASAWSTSVALLIDRCGVPEKQARSFFGRLLSENGLRAQDLLPALSQAMVNKTQDPQAYLRKAADGIAKRRSGGAPKMVGFV